MPQSKIPQNKYLIIYDGECYLCNASVNFILQYDIDEIFIFTHNKTNTASAILSEMVIYPENNSVLLFENEKLYTKSTAALRIARKLKWFKIAYVLIIIPVFLRDFLYEIISKNRYKWFGKSNTCILPNIKNMSRFIID